MGSVRPRSSSRAPPPPDSGTLIAGKYRVERVVGEGGMGTVLAARHELLDVPVAVKVLSSELTRQPKVIARFLREARAVARLKSEHVARVMDVGTIGKGQPFIVMELLEGEDLDRRLRRGPLPIGQAVDFVLHALEAMAHAHAMGIVHRDLKPANLFLTVGPDGREIIKVLDFGIAKLTDDATRGDSKRSTGVTGETNPVGSPAYMAPEQVRASPVIDRRADIWALGAILYELVTGITAFGGGSVGEVFGAVLHSTPRPMSDLRADVPAELEAVVVRCLQREPEARFADVAQLARALAPFGSGEWKGHVARVEQLLTHAARVFDPEESMTERIRLSDLAGIDLSLDPVSVSQKSPRLSRIPAGASSLVPAPQDENPTQLDTVRAPKISARTIWALGAVLTVASAVGGVVAASRLRASPPEDRPTAISVLPATTDPGPAPSLPPAALPAPVTPPAAASAALSAAPPSSGPTTAAKPSPPRSKSVPRASASKTPTGLPNVLRSAD